METYSVARRMSALTLVVTLSVIGMPLPASAAGEEHVAVTRHRALTINGRPLSEFVALPEPIQTLPENRRPVSADRLLGGAPVTDSFEALNSILDPGYEVVVWDEAGRKTRGRVSSISGEEVVVTRRRRWFGSFRSPEELVFGADSITRVDIVDSTWNGALIGAAIAPALVYGVWRCEDNTFPDSNLKGAGTMLVGGMGAFLLIHAGHHIDLSNNESIYERPSQASRVTVAPLIGRDQKSLAVRVSF